jgi:hypothetical protein
MSDGQPRTTGHTDQAERNRKLQDLAKKRQKSLAEGLRKLPPSGFTVGKVASEAAAVQGFRKFMDADVARLQAEGEMRRRMSPEPEPEDL